MVHSKESDHYWGYGTPSVHIIMATEIAGICSPRLHWHRWECREMERCNCLQSLLWKVSKPPFQHKYEFTSEVTLSQRPLQSREPADIILCPMKVVLLLKKTLYSPVWGLPLSSVVKLMSGSVVRLFLSVLPVDWWNSQSQRQRVQACAVPKLRLTPDSSLQVTRGAPSWREPAASPNKHQRTAGEPWSRLAEISNLQSKWLWRAANSQPLCEFATLLAWEVICFFSSLALQ